MAKAEKLAAVPQEWVKAAGASTSVNYQSAFQIPITLDNNRDAEAWAREMYESSPAFERVFVWWGWKAVSAQLGPYPSKDHILGYQIRENQPELIRFSVTWRIGLSCDLILYLSKSSVTLASLVHLRTRTARAAWCLARPIHEYLVPHWLGRAARAAHISAEPDPESS